MKLNKRRAFFLAFAITVLCSLLVVFPMLHTSPDLPVKSDYLVAVEKAIDFFEGSRDPYALLFLDVIYRRFGILEFADALQRFDEEIFSNPLIAPTMSAFSSKAHLVHLNLSALRFLLSMLPQIGHLCEVL